MTELAKQLRHIAADPMWAKGDVYSHVIAEAADSIEALETALRLTRPYIEMHTLNPNGTMATVLAKIDAALAQSSPPARQENDDVFKGFRGNNEA
jgi:hypothetical protein